MFYNYSHNSGYDYNECIARGACSVSPNVSAIQEVMLIIFKQMADYVLKLDEIEEEGLEDIKISIIGQLIMLDSVAEYSEEQLLSMFNIQYNNLIKLKTSYQSHCKAKGLKCSDIKDILKFSPDMKLSNIIKIGEKAYLERLKQITSDKKYISEILLSVIKSVASNIIVFSEFGKSVEFACNKVLDALNLFNKKNIKQEEIKIQISSLAELNIELFKLIFSAKIAAYGDITETEVSYSTRPNKAILVSGSNFSDLHAVLAAAQNDDIDVYSNGNLLISHAFSLFKEYKNFVGHFGNGVDSTILDFATFPGSILLTKNETKNVEYLYRGRLFTTDRVSPKGIVQIVNNDYTHLINSALEAKGFAKGQERNSVVVGYNEDSLNKKLDYISENFNKGEYEYLFIIGLANYSSAQHDYFKKLFKLLPKKSYVISFSYGENSDNSFVLNLGNDYSIVLNVLAKLFEKIQINSENLIFFLTKCDVNTLSNIINLKEKGAKNIFLTECPPFIVNPMVLKEFIKIFDVHNTTTPGNDIESILNNK